MTNEKPHPLKGRKKSAASIAKRLETLKKNKAARERGELPPVPRATGFRKKRKGRHVETRTHEQLARDVEEAIWCLEQSIKKTRSGIRDGRVSLTEVTDEETFMYMAIRYLQGGLKP